MGGRHKNVPADEKGCAGYVGCGFLDSNVLCVARTKLLSPAANSGSASLHNINRPSALHTRSQVTLHMAILAPHNNVRVAYLLQRRQGTQTTKIQFSIPRLILRIHAVDARTPARDTIRVPPNSKSSSRCSRTSPCAR